MGFWMPDGSRIFQDIDKTKVEFLSDKEALDNSTRTSVTVPFSYYCITLNFREHFIFALIRESREFAKIKCREF